MREMFIRFEDVEYFSRLGEPDSMWLIGPSRIAHKDPRPVAGADLRTMWGDYSQRIPFSQQWKRLYGWRNQLYCGFRDGYVHIGHALSHLLVQAVRTILFHERPLRTLHLLAIYALEARRGRFRNVPPARWSGLARARSVRPFLDRESLRYDEDAAPAPVALAARR
jgi:hypothetical protein